MKEILLRAGKSPFDVISPEKSLDYYPAGVFGKNVGNLVFGDAMHKILSVPDVNVVPNTFLSERVGINEAYYAQINDRFSHFVIPLANAFRTSFLDSLNRLSTTIEHLDIPVTVAGVGVSGGAHSLGRDLLDVPPELVDGVNRFMRAVLDRSAKVGVRGENTYRFLRGLGYDDSQVEVIGCPSLFRNGLDLKIEKRLPKLTPSSNVNINISPYVPVMSRVARFHQRKYENLEYIAQDVETLRLLLWGVDPKEIVYPKMPIHSGHDFYQRDKISFFVDSRTWINHLAERDFSFGTRIHGNIASLVAGTPAYVLVHDTRTQELADYHQIPYTLVPDLPEQVDAARLYEQADYTGFNEGHRERYERFTGFLELNGLEHIFEPGKANPEYDQRLEDLEFPGAVHRIPESTGQTQSRLAYLWETARERLDRNAYRFTAPVPHVKPAKHKAQPQKKSLLRRVAKKLLG